MSGKLLKDLRGQLAATATLREDIWWLEPLLIVLGLGAFVVYTTWAGLQGAHYEYKNYLSPFYSPTFKPSWWPFSPAILILWGPAGFRLTCYYYRKAYYRSFWWAPPACAVRDARAGYTGETGFPLILQNIHRYFFYVATAFLIFLWYDAVHAFIFDGRFGVALGSIIMLANVAFLSMYAQSRDRDLDKVQFKFLSRIIFDRGKLFEHGGEAAREEGTERVNLRLYEIRIFRERSAKVPEMFFRPRGNGTDIGDDSHIFLKNMKESPDTKEVRMNAQKQQPSPRLLFCALCYLIV